MAYPKFIVSNEKEESISIQRVNIHTDRPDPEQKVYGQIRLQGYKTFFMLNSTEHKIDHAHTTGILTFISMINTTSESLKEIKVFICQHFSFHELSCLIELSMKKFNNLGARLIRANFTLFTIPRQTLHVFNLLDCLSTIVFLSVHWKLFNEILPMRIKIKSF